MSTTNADSLLRESAFAFAGMGRCRLSPSDIATWRGAWMYVTPILFRGSAFVFSCRVLSRTKAVGIERRSWSNDGER